MHENTRKSFYVFLSMVLGVLLFLMIQRAAFLVAFLLGADIGSVSSQALGVVTSMVAVVFGAWYGIWLGLTWYAAVYEEQHVRSMFRWLWDGAAPARQKPGSWEFDDLLAFEEGSSNNVGAKLEFFEANTVQFGGGPVSAESVHAHHVPVSTRAKTSAKKAPRKAAARKSVS